MAVVHRTASHWEASRCHDSCEQGHCSAERAVSVFPEIAISLSKSVSITLVDTCVEFTIHCFSAGHKLTVSWTGTAQPV